jgi:hypothetical protein
MNKIDQIQDEENVPSEIDFSKGVLGKFFREDSRLNIPVYLDREIRNRLEAIALERGVGISDVANGLLREDIVLLETEK